MISFVVTELRSVLLKDLSLVVLKYSAIRPISKVLQPTSTKRPPFPLGRAELAQPGSPCVACRRLLFASPLLLVHGTPGRAELSVLRHDCAPQRDGLQSGFCVHRLNSAPVQFFAKSFAPSGWDSHPSLRRLHGVDRIELQGPRLGKLAQLIWIRDQGMARD